MANIIDADQREYQQELQEHNLLQDALEGNNLLGMMLEDKPKYGVETDVSRMRKGVDAMDLFIDPLSVFGSERHPALQEVLKQLNNQKQNRGEITELRCKA